MQVWVYPGIAVSLPKPQGGDKQNKGQEKNWEQGDLKSKEIENAVRWPGRVSYKLMMGFSNDRKVC